MLYPCTFKVAFLIKLQHESVRSQNQGAYTPGHLKFKAIQDYLKKKFKTVLTTYVLLSAVNIVNINFLLN